MAVVATAVVIDVADGSWGPGRLGPYAYGGNLFTVNANSDVVDGATVEVFKSADNGLTWAESDAANHPAKSGSCTSCRSGDVLTLAYRRSSVLRIITFDLATELYGTEESTGINKGLGEITACANGFILVMGGSYLQRLSGVWSQVTYETLTIDQFINGAGVALDPDDNIHLFYTISDNSVFPAVLTAFHRRLLNDGTLGAAQAMTGPTDRAVSFRRGTVAGTHIVMPVKYQQNDFSSQALYAWVSDIYGSDAPTWATELIDSQANNGGTPVAFTDGSTAVVFYVGDTDGTNSTRLTQYATSAGTGTWSSPVEWYDAGANSMLEICAERISAGVYGACGRLSASSPFDFISLIDNSSPARRVRNFCF